jgi:hypothetical protein
MSFTERPAIWFKFQDSGLEPDFAPVIAASVAEMACLRERQLPQAGIAREDFDSK